MSHLDPSTLSQYNSLVDPHLQSYFSNERVQSHLKHAGLISGRGEIISDGEYRTKLARREHKKHVRHILAENIVNRAIDMERARQAEMKRQFDMVAKAALVNNIKESRRRSGTFSGLMSNSADMALLSIDSSQLQIRPKSATHLNEMFNEPIRIPRIQSAHTDGDHRRKYSSKTRNRRRSFRKSKNRSSSPQRSRSPAKYSDSSSHPCQITMVYYGPKMQVDYDHLVFEPIDEIIVMQQHCGGENIIVYKEYLKPGAEFTFASHRHSDYPFGLTFYVKGFIDSRISTCCEYKHQHGVRLGAGQGHFAIKSVKGSKPCIKCRIEKQARLNKYDQLSKDNKKIITISLPVSDEPKMQQTPVQIPVRRTSISTDTYSEDFEGSDKQKRSGRNGYSTDSSTKRSHTSERKLKSKDSTPKVPKRVLPMVRKKSSRKSSFTSHETLTEKIKKKTWQIIFHTSNIPTGKNIFIKFSFIANDEDDETETYEINMKRFNENSKGERQYSFPVQLEDIGKPEQIRLKMDAEEKDIKWDLDHIELIDPKTQSHSIFPCKKPIRSSKEKVLRLSQESSRNERTRKTSSSTNNSRPSSSNYKIRPQSPKLEQKAKTSSRSSTSPDIVQESPSKFTSVRPIFADSRSNQSQKSTPHNDINDQENKIRYRVTIYPSNDDDGEFNPVRNSRIFLRLNNQTKETNLTKKTDQLCPTFESGVKQTFELDLIQDINEKPKKLTIGYVNSDIAAMKWKLEKIILHNVETGEETIFPCKEILSRNEANFRAEKTFEIQSDQSDDEPIPRNQKINSPKSDHEEQIQTSEKQQIDGNNKQKPPPFPKKNEDKEEIQSSEKQQTNGNNKQKSSSFQKLSDDEEQIQTPNKQHTNGNEKQKSPSFQSMNDDEAHYRKIFKQLDPDSELELGSPRHSPTPRPTTRRGLQDQNKQQATTQPVDPLIGLDRLADQTARSNDQQNQNSLPSTTIDNGENQFKDWYQKNDDDEEEDN